MAKVLTKELLREAIETVKEVYLEDRIPWICGYSGGKDSSATVQLVWMALREIPPEKRVKTVHVISTDTMVESPVVALWAKRSLKRMKEGAEREMLPIVPHRLTPAIEDTFWVNLSGHQTGLSGKSSQRRARPSWCWAQGRLRAPPGGE